MKLIIFIITMLFSVLSVCIVTKGLRINEIMYNPEGDDYDFEFVELYADNYTDVSNHSFEGIEFQFPVNTSFQGFLVIANTMLDEGQNNDFFDRYNFSPNFEYSGILSNTGESLVLFDANDTVVHNITYSDSAESGYSLEFVNDSFIQSLIFGGTPGKENHVLDQLINLTNSSINNTNSAQDSTMNSTDVNNSENPGLNQTFNSTMNNTVVNQTANLTINSTNTTSPNKNISINASVNYTNVCDPFLELDLEDKVYLNKERISYDFVVQNISDYEFGIEYAIKTLAGEYVRKKRTTSNTNPKSFTPSLDYKEGVFLITGELVPDCEDSNLSNNQVNQILVVYNPGFREAEEGRQTKTKADKKTEERLLKAAKPDNGINKPKIKSFYTRTKNFEVGKQIRFFSSIESPREGFQFLFAHNNNSQIIDVKKDKTNYEFNISLAGGNNTVNLSLQKGSGQILDSKQITIPLPSLEVGEKQGQGQLLMKNTGESFKNVTKLQLNTEVEDIETIVFEGGNAKKFVHYLLLGLSVAFNIILIWKR